MALIGCLLDKIVNLDDAAGEARILEKLFSSYMEPLLKNPLANIQVQKMFTNQENVPKGAQKLTVPFNPPFLSSLSHQIFRQALYEKLNQFYKCHPNAFELILAFEVEIFIYTYIDKNKIVIHSN